MPVVMMTANATIPMNMLGKPKTELCQVCMTWPQEIHGLMSQAVWYPGSLRTSSFSKTKVPEASQPMTPVMSRSQPRGLSRVKRGPVAARWNRQFASSRSVVGCWSWGGIP